MAPDEILDSLVLRSNEVRPDLVVDSRGPVNACATYSPAQGEWLPRRVIHVHARLLQLPKAELEAILAHELGHHHYAHPIWLGNLRMVLFLVLLLLWTLWSGAGALAFSCVLIVAYAYVVRWSEFAADMWAAKHCGAGHGMLTWLLRRPKGASLGFHPSPASRAERLCRYGCSRPVSPGA